MQNLVLGRLMVPLAALLAAATLAPKISAAAAASLEPESVLYSFCARGGKTCTDGEEPVAGLVRDAAGRLYGTTEVGGAHIYGTVFELTPNAAKTKWTETIIYNFCAQGGELSCTDGERPLAGLIMDTAGHLYGTTSGGGGGTVFELTPKRSQDQMDTHDTVPFRHA
ncbi:MAG TPA: choice-of-anchor tandem repeat GloVer-containing protein [Stellaceae bacterium]